MPRKKPLAAKEWYWEAEQDKIAADEDLKLIPSPEGWKSEGLECVGLWFLMMNQMARSQRKGFLCDRADENKPMSMEDFAKLTGRDKEVILLVLKVILGRNLFSRNEQGIIYSRGMVRKEELRKIRSKAGKKGGLRTKDLLKQNADILLEQKEEQNLGIGIGIGIESENLTGSDFAQAKVETEKDTIADPSARLAFIYRSHVRGRKPEDAHLCVDFFAELLGMGFSEEELTADLKRKPPERNRGEHLWEIRKRLEGAKKGPDRGRSKPSSPENANRFRGPGKPIEPEAIETADVAGSCRDS